MTARNTSLATIAHGFLASDVALTIAALEGAGFDVFVPSFQMVAQNGHFSVGLGGIPVQVPAKDAFDAANFLAALQSGNIHCDDPAFAEPSPVKEKSPWRSGGIRVFVMLVLASIGIARPPRGLFLRRQTKGER